DPQPHPQLVGAHLRQVLAIRAQAETADLQGPDALLQGLFEGAADGHHFPHRFHGGGEEVLGPGEFLEGPAGDLDYAIVNGGLERGVGLPGDVVVDLIQGEAHRQLGGDLGDGEAGGLGGQGRGAGHPGVHLDDHISPVCGWMANWMLEPPVSTPISRMMAMAASRIIWYSRSVRVCAGATVMESPVCTPMGSRFSMEQMITTLSRKSRITSSSNSFQPNTDSSSITSLIILAARPSAACSLKSSR